jgi:hypothetical protein
MALGSVEVGSAAVRRLAVLGALALLVSVVLAACGGGGNDEGDRALFCERLDRLTRNDPFLAFGDQASADDIQVAFSALVERADELLDVAPPEARGAARDYTEAARALDALLADADYAPTGVDTRAYRDEQVAYTEAAQRLERYLNAEC